MPAESPSDHFPARKIWVLLFIRWAGALLLALALVNLVNAVTGGPSLTVLDPLLGIPLRVAVLAAGGLELVVALICLFGYQPTLQSGLIAWLATNFAVYRAGLLWQGWHTQWGCLGNPLDKLRLLPDMADQGLYCLLACLLLGGYAALICLWFETKERKIPQPVTTKPSRVERGQEAVVRSLKISCTACGGHIEFPTNFFGERIACPHCQVSIILQKNRNLKMSCIACDGHIEFPTHAVGETIPCPHCKMDITLKEPA